MTTFKVGDRVRHKYAPATCVGVVVDARDLDTKVLVDRSDYAVPQPDERWIPNYNLEHEPRPVAHEDSPVLVENIALTIGLDRWPVLVPFIAAMVRKLDANKPKKGGREGWRNDNPDALVRRVIEEAEELEHAVDTEGARGILLEAADVANMAMMVADASGALDATRSFMAMMAADASGAPDVPQAFIVRGDPPVASPISDEVVRSIRLDYQKRVLAALEEWNERPSDTRSPIKVVMEVEIP